MISPVTGLPIVPLAAIPPSSPVGLPGQAPIVDQGAQGVVPLGAPVSILARSPAGLASASALLSSTGCGESGPLFWMGVGAGIASLIWVGASLLWRRGDSGYDMTCLPTNLPLYRVDPGPLTPYKIDPTVPRSPIRIGRSLPTPGEYSDAEMSRRQRASTENARAPVRCPDCDVQMLFSPREGDLFLITIAKGARTSGVYCPQCGKTDSIPVTL